MIDQKKVNIKSLKIDPKGGSLAIYAVGHNNGETTLRLDLTLTQSCSGRGWTADMQFTDFPRQKTAEGAAQKLADWMERMSEAIRSGEYSNINLNNP